METAVRRGRGSRSALGIAALAVLLWLGGGRPAAVAGGSRAPHPAVDHAGTYPFTATDDLGRRVTFTAAPRRVISLAPGHTETLFALGAGGRLVAVDRYSDYPAEAGRRTRLNCWPHPPVEQIVALKPDLVVVLTEGADFIRQMETLHIPVLKLFPENYPRVLQEIRLLGRVTGTSPAAERLTRRMEARAREVREALAGAPRVRAMYELDATDPARPFVAGSRGFYAELIRMAGGENVFQDLPTSAAQVSAESVLSRNPAVILLGDSASPQQPQSVERLRSRPGWSAVAAVRTGRVFPVNSDQITRPGPRLVEGLAELARRLHPDRFR